MIVTSSSTMAIKSEIRDRLTYKRNEQLLLKMKAHNLLTRIVNKSLFSNTRLIRIENLRRFETYAKYNLNV